MTTVLFDGHSVFLVALFVLLLFAKLSLSDISIEGPQLTFQVLDVPSAPGVKPYSVQGLTNALSSLISKVEFLGRFGVR